MVGLVILLYGDLRGAARNYVAVGFCVLVAIYALLFVRARF